MAAQYEPQATDSDEAPLAAAGKPGRLGPLLRRAALASLLLLGAAAMLACLSTRQPSGRVLANVRGTVGLQSIEADLAAAKAHNPDWDPEYWDQLVSGKKAENREEVDERGTCRGDEELFGGLCYKKCELLTASAYPIRTTAFTCCKERPCHPFNSRKDMGFCSGFSVAGGESGSCPHPPSACESNEEVAAGVCYTKCSLLTNGEYPHRLTNMACCKMEMSYKCMFPGNLKLSSSFNVGSGVSEGNGGGGGSEAEQPNPSSQTV